MKKCKICLIEKNDSFFWSRELFCKECKNQKRRERKRINKENNDNLQKKKQKTCVVCNNIHKRKCYDTCSMKCLIKKRTNENNGCWEWQGSVNEHNYGVIAIKRKTFFAHRISFNEYKGEIPKGFCLLHSCDNSRCVNPEHLRIGTRAENCKEMYLKKRNRCQFGEERFCAKLKEEDVFHIRSLIDSGKKQQDIADLYNLHNSAISNIKTGKTWKHLKQENDVSH